MTLTYESASTRSGTWCTRAVLHRCGTAATQAMCTLWLGVLCKTAASVCSQVAALESIVLQPIAPAAGQQTARGLDAPRSGCMQLRQMSAWTLRCARGNRRGRAACSARRPRRGRAARSWAGSTARVGSRTSPPARSAAFDSCCCAWHALHHQESETRPSGTDDKHVRSLTLSCIRPIQDRRRVSRTSGESSSWRYCCLLRWSTSSRNMMHAGAALHVPAVTSCFHGSPRVPRVEQVAVSASRK